MQDDEDSFYVVDLGRVIHLYDAWKDKLPLVQPFYAVKCNEDPALIKTLAALGTGFDCASKVYWYHSHTITYMDLVMQIQYIDN